MKIIYKAKAVNLDIKKVNTFGKFLGLMFRSAKKSKNLLFEFEKNTSTSFHSCFVFFPFLILWLDSNNEVIEYKIVKPFTFKVSCSKKFKKCIEIPLKKENKTIIKFFVGKRKDLNI